MKNMVCIKSVREGDQIRINDKNYVVSGRYQNKYGKTYVRAIRPTCKTGVYNKVSFPDTIFCYVELNPAGKAAY